MSGTLSLTFNNTPGSVTLPIIGTGVAVSVNWGDTTTTTSLSHTYSGAGPFTAVITITAGTITAFGSDGWAGVANLTDVSTNNVSTWGLGSPASVTSFQYLFKGATLLTSVPSNVPPSVENMSFMFTAASIFNQDISSWDVSHVLTMLLMFAGATSFNQDISIWDVTSALTMEGMFLNASLFNQDISGWNVSSAVNMKRMLEGAIIFNQNIRIWQVGASTDLTNMFNGAAAFQLEYYGTTPGYDTDPNTPLYTFFSYSPPPPQPIPVPRLAVGGGGGSFWFGVDGFLYKRKGGGGARRSTKMAPGGNTTCNGPTYIYNKYNPGNTGIGAQSTAVRRAKNIKAAVCGPKIPCGQFYNYLGLYDNYTGNPNGYVIYPRPNF
jgi:hypothetical protein